MTRRQVKRLALRILRALGAFDIARWMTRKRVRILGYHGAWLGDARFAGDGLFMRPSTFRRRLELLRQLDYPIVPLQAAVDGLAGRLPLPPCAVVITVDDAWLGMAHEMWPALRERGIPATLYVDTANLLSGGAVEHVERRYVARYGDHVRDSGTCAYMSVAELREARAAGLHVQLHTHTHSMRGFDPAAVQEEIERNREALALIFGEEPDAFRHLAYPSGKCEMGLQPVLEAAGVQSATTVRRALARSDDDPHFLPRLLDSERDSEIEFEAELAGVLDLLRALAGRLGGLRRSTVLRRTAAAAPTGARRAVAAGPLPSPAMASNRSGSWGVGAPPARRT